VNETRVIHVQGIIAPLSTNSWGVSTTVAAATRSCVDRDGWITWYEYNASVDASECSISAGWGHSSGCTAEEEEFFLPQHWEEIGRDGCFLYAISVFFVHQRSEERHVFEEE
jgi:hypothetical protein